MKKSEIIERKANELIELFMSKIENLELQNYEEHFYTAKKLALACVFQIQEAGKQRIVLEYFDDIFWRAVQNEINERKPYSETRIDISYNVKMSKKEAMSHLRLLKRLSNIKNEYDISIHDKNDFIKIYLADK